MEKEPFFEDLDKMERKKEQIYIIWECLQNSSLTEIGFINDLVLSFAEIVKQIQEKDPFLWTQIVFSISSPAVSTLEQVLEIYTTYCNKIEED
jgi:hypothetical protein